MQTRATGHILDNAIEYLKGVGPQRAEWLNKELDIHTFGDLLFHFPFRYVDRSRFHKVREVHPQLPYIQLRGKVSAPREVPQKRGKRLVALFSDDTGSLALIWFKGARWIKKYIKPDTEYVVFGKPNLYKRKLNIVHPEMEPAETYESGPGGALQPVYPTTEKLKKTRIDSKALMKLQRTLIGRLTKPDLPEILPSSLVRQYDFPSRWDALRNIHFPESTSQLEKARQRLKFEELFLIQLRMLQLREIREQEIKGFVFGHLGNLFHTFYDKKLAFELTGAQKRVLKQMRKDVRSGKQMNRLLQGDVGSGKTVVALMVMLMALDNGFQAAMMAPTEILATQHYQTLSEMLDGMPVQVGLLTGAMKGKQRAAILEQVAAGDIHILLGTHALITKDVTFRRLGLSVIDEQHRFGVAQRARLWMKGKSCPHVLVMSATPIPRTLAMTIYGDLDVSVIDELPPGRKPVKTAHRTDRHRLRVFGFIKAQLQKGHQAYIVYPLIEESEKMDYKDLMDGYESIQRAFQGYQISIVHGRMKADAKAYEMARFVKGEAHIMVATNVIEVGVNVANANVMVIESAERFGLSQLHQLRGRVGRSSHQAYCILMTANQLSNEAQQRVQTMTQTNDGFKIAEADLELRGAGDLQGKQQSGAVPLRIADLVADTKVLQEARSCARRITEADPLLERPEHKRLHKHLKEIQKDQPVWGRVS